MLRAEQICTGFNGTKAAELKEHGEELSIGERPLMKVHPQLHRNSMMEGAAEGS